MIHNFNAYLSYTDINRGPLVYNMWIMEYTQPHQLAGEEYQSRMYKHFYPKSYAPGNISITGRVPLQKDYDNLAEFIRGHHLTLMTGPGLNNAPINSGASIALMQMGIPDEGIYVEGIIENFQAGAKRFNVAPEILFDFFVIKDNHSKTTDMTPEYTKRAMWDGSFVQVGNVQTTTAPPASNPVIAAPAPVPGVIPPPIPLPNFPGSLP